MRLSYSLGTLGRNKPLTLAALRQEEHYRLPLFVLATVQPLELLLALHALAALFHHYVQRGNVLRRMATKD